MKRTLSINPKNRLNRSGFSLVEMLIVIALIAVIGTLLIGRIGSLFEGSQEDVARQFVTNSMTAPLLQYRIHMGSYPSTDQGLEALLTAPSERSERWRGPYIDRLPEDPWGRSYQYRYPGTRNTDSYDLWSMGSRNSEETIIGNW
ncbi:MAG: type II secretion system major pseudopilin GspG [Opitutales bacterium]|nr:type II secretion system major pseudopilin GspG [Opitutales bacterium]